MTFNEQLEQYKKEAFNESCPKKKIDQSVETVGNRKNQKPIKPTYRGKWK